MRFAVGTIAIFAVVLGIAFRFSDLNAPLFWQDEAITALRVTGHTKAEYLSIFDGRIRPVAAIARFESLEPGRGVGSVVRGLALEEPQHPPLFYILDRLWIGAFGTTAAGFRGCSALIGTLGIALAFALGAALGRSRVAGAVAAAFFALSPIFVLYARQAREYAFFPDAVMLATLAFVRAMRGGGAPGWFAYAASVALGFYVDPIFALVVAGHGLSALLEPGARLPRLGAWFAASLAGAFAFLPWALGALRSSGDISDQLDWGRTAYPLKYLVQKWTFNVGALAFDGEFKALALAPVAVLVALGALVALAVFVRHGERSAVRIVAPLAAITFVVFEGRDVVLGSHFATIVRYLSPLWLGLLFAATAVIAHGLVRGGARTRALALGALLATVAAGAAAGFIRGGAENWWDNNDQVAFQAMAREIDRSDRPLVITQFRPHVPLVMARYLRPDAEFLTFDKTAPALPPGRHAFLVAPSRDVREALVARTRGRYRMENVSPNATTIIRDFHKKLDRAKPELFRGDAPIFVPENALWALVPVRAR